MKLQAKAKVAKEAKSAAKKTEDVPKVSVIIVISLFFTSYKNRWCNALVSCYSILQVTYFLYHVTVFIIKAMKN